MLAELGSQADTNHKNQKVYIWHISQIVEIANQQIQMRVFSDGVDKHFFIFRDGLSEEQIYYVRPRHTSDHVTKETSTDVMF